jgi:hypothetical protein
LKHLTLPDIKDFNALELYLMTRVFRQTLK